jgi:hypothetical protein
VSTGAESQPVSEKQALIERCKEEYPQALTGLTMQDYFDYEQHGTEIYYYPDEDYPDRYEEPLFQTMIEGQRESERHTYLTSPDRNKRIENQIQEFAEGMVQKANSGDKSYRFIMLDEDGGGMDVDAQVPEDFEGFGYLAKGKYVGEPTRHDTWEREELANSIYRHRDGSYYPHPGTSYLSIADKHFISTFDLVPAGYTDCAYVPGNAVTQGAHVNYYEFIGPGSSPWYENADHIQRESYYANSAEDAAGADNHAIESLKLSPGL